MEKKGLLDFIASPEGQGLLAMAFGGMAGARRGEPLNSLGRAGMAGIAGYGGAMDRNAQAAKEAQAAAMQKMQMDRLNKPDAPAFNQEAGGFTEPPSAEYPQGRIVRPDGFAPKEAVRDFNQPFLPGGAPNVPYQDYQRSLKPIPEPTQRNIDPAILAREKWEHEKKNPQLGSGVEGKPMTAWQESQYRNKIADDYKSVGSLINTVDDVKAAGTALKDHKGLKGVAGIQGYFPSNPYGDAAGAEVKLNNLKGKVTSMGKAIMAASGSIGPMAVQEWKIVADSVVAMNPKTADAKSIQDQIDLVNETADRMSALANDSYTKQYGEDFERYPQFRDLPKSRLGGGEAKPTAPKDYSSAAAAELKRRGK